MRVDFDDQGIQRGLDAFLKSAISRKDKALKDIASEVLRLSQREVPHNVGTLQNSGAIEDENDYEIVGYNTVYAARLHEHPEYRFKNGRKGKYLEDPIKNNKNVFLDYYKKIVTGGIE
jgi:hypothetical protein